MRGWIHFLAIVGCALTLDLASTSPVRADAQWSVRLALGGGLTLGDLPREGLFESALRSEVLFGAPGDEHARVGFAADIRHVDFDTAEGSLGLGLLIPTWRGFPIVLTALAGWALRPGEDGFIGVGTLGWGYRSYNYHGAYGLALQGYVSTRIDLEEPRNVQLTFGVEIDLELLFVIPVLAIRNRIRRGDPDEPTQELSEQAHLSPSSSTLTRW